MLFGKLLPREGNFFEMFNQHGDLHRRAARASFMQLIAQLRRRRRCASKYAAEVDATPSAPPTAITAEVNRLLHKTFITPIDREQIHGLINAMDDVARPAAGLDRNDVAVRRAPDDRRSRCA